MYGTDFSRSDFTGSDFTGTDMTSGFTADSGDWGFYLNGSEAAGGYAYDVAGTWNEHAAQSDFYLDQATSSIDHGGDMLWNASANLGTDPAAVNGYLNESVNDFNATNNAMWQSMGFSGTPDF